MPSNFTQNYQLNQWSMDDQVLMADFNADNAKTDAAIKGEADARAAGDAALSARIDDLSANKADALALSALSQTVSKKGNCKLITGSYTGTGECGSNAPNTITFSRKPLMVLIYSNGPFIVAFPDNSHAMNFRGSSLSNQYVQTTWEGNTISWYTKDVSDQMNYEGAVYRYIAFVEA